MAASLIIAAAFITGLVVGDLVGYLPLPLGAAGHEGAIVIVGLPGDLTDHAGEIVPRARHVRRSAAG